MAVHHGKPGADAGPAGRRDLCLRRRRQPAGRAPPGREMRRAHVPADGEGVEMPSPEEYRGAFERKHKERVANYYSAEMGEASAKQFVAGGGGGVDDLDNILYYLLNHFTASDIRQRLKLAAEVHPNEIARVVFAPKDDSEDEDNLIPRELPEPAAVERDPSRPLSKLDQAKKLLGG